MKALNAGAVAKSAPEHPPHLAMPVELLEQLPIGLVRDPVAEAKAQSLDGHPIKIYRGHRDGADFVIHAEFDTLVIKRRRPNEQAKTYKVTVGYAPISSPWTIVEVLCRWLKSSDHSSLDIGHVVAEMPLLRETTTLVPIAHRFENYLTSVQNTALAYVAEQSGLAGLQLYLTFPFQICAGPDERSIWNGYVLPQPLNELRATMVVHQNRNDFCFQPVEVFPGVLDESPVEAMRQLHMLAASSEECIEELERFAKRLKDCSAALH